MFDVSSFIWGSMFGLIGTAYFIYGKKRGAFIPMASGAILFIMPYFTSSLITLIITGFIFVLLPFFLKL